MIMKQKIAIIEDESAIAEMYRFKLEQSGYEVRCAYNGKAGLELIESFRPALILLDLMLPEMSGDDVLEKVRATDWGRDIRVLVLTNISEDVAPPKLKLLNVDRYVVKAQYTPSQVAGLVDEALADEKTAK
jgi:DNA-binding response OmpR family regulator